MYFSDLSCLIIDFDITFIAHALAKWFSGRTNMHRCPCHAEWLR